MQRSTALLWWHLGILTYKRYRALREVYGSMDDTVSDVGMRMFRELGVRADVLDEVEQRRATFESTILEADLVQMGVELMTIEDAAYPSQLREIPDPPIFLSYRGELTLLDQPMVSVVGTRAMSAYGRRIVEHFVPAFVRAGVVTVSGLALGVDAAVATETLRSGGRTIAVLGHGLAHVFPSSHRALADDMLARGGLLLSEFALTQKPDTYTFPARNRIIAALGAGTLVCQAPEKSGSMITAELALDYNRDVYAACGQIFDPQFAGCHRLIREGRAKLVSHPDDVLVDIGVVAPASADVARYQPASQMEESILITLTTMPQIIDDIALKTGLATGTVTATLTLLELEGAAKNIGGGQWVRASSL